VVVNRPQHSKEDVVRAAGRLFAERGFHGTSMRDLGDELGLLGSSLYSHIDGKSELLIEVIRRGGSMFQDLADTVLATEVAPAEQLRLLIRGHVQIVVDHLDEARTFLNEARFLQPQERTVVLEMRDRYEQTYRRIIERGVACGDFSEQRDPALMAILILSLLNALERWYRPGGRNDPDEISQRMNEFVTNGIG
jgi:AcrR family transcriptional regulator